MASKRANFKDEKLRLAILRLIVKNHNVLFVHGHTGKGEMWHDIAQELNIKFPAFEFKSHGVRDWATARIKEFDKTKFSHLKLTGISENENATANPMQLEDRTLFDILCLRDELVNMENAKKAELEQKGKLEKEMREAATKGLSRKRKGKSSESSSEADREFKKIKSSRELIEESNQNVGSFMTSYLEQNQRQLDIQERHVNAQAVNGENTRALIATLLEMVKK